jgi:8-oxo-dGTP pyrophosphatase MutT (NUDIX family)
MIKSKQQLKKIKQCFSSGTLPGKKAMYKMAPISRRHAFEKSTDYRPASVLLLLYLREGELFFPLIERTSHNPNDKHRGQISLPGGKKEDVDENNWACAIREAEEELGIAAQKVEFIGALTPNYIPVSNFEVHPFVGFRTEKPNFKRQESEVAAYFEVPLKELLKEENKKSGEISLNGEMRLQDIPYFVLAGKKVWGATAMILNEFVHLINGHLDPEN